MIFSFVSKICIFKKKSDLYLRKIQISFGLKKKKIRSVSKEDADPFYFEEKLRSASKEDANPFYFEEKFRFASKRCRSILF